MSVPTKIAIDVLTCYLYVARYSVRRIASRPLVRGDRIDRGDQAVEHLPASPAMGDLVGHRVARRVAAVAEVQPAGAALDFAQLRRPGGEQGAAQRPQLVVGLDPEADLEALSRIVGVGRSRHSVPSSSRSPLSGRAKPSTAPPPSRGPAQIRPSWASTIRLQTASPTPTPPAVRRAWSARKNGVKTSSATSDAMPIPRSRIRTIAVSPSMATSTSTGSPTGLYLSALLRRFSTSISSAMESAWTISDGRWIEKRISRSG